MNTVDITVTLITYVIGGIIFGFLGYGVYECHKRIPRDAAPALGMLTGLLWPLALVAIVAVGAWIVIVWPAIGLWRSLPMFGRSFAVLWWHVAGKQLDGWRERRAVPRAQARVRRS